MRKAWILAFALGSSGACHRHAATDAPSSAALLAPAKDAVVKTTENGPVKVTVTVWPGKPTLGEPIYLRLAIDAPAGITVDAPIQDAGDARLGRFTVVGFAKDAHPRDGGGTHEEQTYTLDAQTSGKQRLPPLRLEMVDARAGVGSAATGKQELLTDEVSLDVAPVAAAAIGAELHGATGKLDPNVGGTPWLWLVLGASVLAVAGAGGTLAWRGLQARRRIAAQRSAYEEAVGRLRALEGRGAPGADQADAWFVELSGIVRDYLERRYEIRAPERTTEEFLQEAAKAEALTAAHRAGLSAFLAQCDRVKFAGYRPEATESIEMLAAARAFVEDTRVREPESAAGAVAV